MVALPHGFGEASVDIFTSIKPLSHSSASLHSSSEFDRQPSSPYVRSLEQRCKWNRLKLLVKVGDLVLVQDDRLQSRTMARVVLCHPGTDGHTRVVTLKDVKGTLKRAIVKIFVFPIGTLSNGQPITVYTD